MPVILPDDAYDLWLDPGFQKADAICDLLKPFDPDLMRRYEVSSRVNLVKNDDAAMVLCKLQVALTPWREQEEFRENLNGRQSKHPKPRGSRKVPD